MKTKVTFYHAGCPICLAAEHNIAAGLDPTRFDVEKVDLSKARQRIGEANAWA